MERSLSQKLVAEFVGTFTLVFIGAGSIIATAVGLPGAGIVTIALAHGLAYGTMIAALGHVSGGHFNPAVTFGIWIGQRIKASQMIQYIVTQCAGGLAAAALLRAAVQKGYWNASGIKLGAPQVQANISNGQAVLIEAVLTFFLVWVVFGTVIDREHEGSFSKVAGLAIGFVVVMDMMMGSPFTGAAMNPARSLGPALLSGSWKGWWVYWIGPLAGGTVAAALYDGVILRTRAPEPAPSEEPGGVAPNGM